MNTHTPPRVPFRAPTSRVPTSRKAFLASAAGLALASVFGRGIAAAESVSASAAPGRADDAFPLGVAGYSMREFSVDETLRWLGLWGLRSWAIKDVHLPISSSAETIATLQAKCQAAGVKIYAAGVIYMKTEAEVANAFAYAKRLEIDLIVGVPEVDLLPAVEKAVQASGIRLAIHNHGPDMGLFPTPQSAYDQIKGLDPRIGLCIDIGHTQRCGLDPSDSLEKYADRVFDMHIKDVDRASADGKTVPLGHGVINIHRLVRTMRKVRFAGVCGLEYESTKEATLAGMAETAGYLRGVLRSS
jgi:sugar phosphate isomerase/epimerase